MDVKNSLVELSELALDTSYYRQSIPGIIDEEISEIILALSKCDKKDIDIVACRISGDNGRVLGLFAERMASLAVRKNSIEPVKLGLFALLVYARSVEPREVLLVLSLIHDAILKVGHTPINVFNDISASFYKGSLLGNFIKRSEEDKSIDAMGYKETECQDGFLYVRTW